MLVLWLDLRHKREKLLRPEWLLRLLTSSRPNAILRKSGIKILKLLSRKDAQYGIKNSVGLPLVVVPLISLGHSILHCTVVCYFLENSMSMIKMVMWFIIVHIMEKSCLATCLPILVFGIPFAPCSLF